MNLRSILGRNMKPKIIHILGSIMLALSLALLTVTPSSAADTIYQDGMWIKEAYIGTSNKSSLIGGRAFHVGTVVILRTQTVLSDGYAKYTMEGANGAAADHTHVRVYNASERCRWLPAAGGGGTQIWNSYCFVGGELF